jgi:hypothetical protein
VEDGDTVREIVRMVSVWWHPCVGRGTGAERRKSVPPVSSLFPVLEDAYGGGEGRQGVYPMSAT